MSRLLFIFIISIGLFNNVALAEENIWDGWYLGLSYTRSNTRVNANYAHYHSAGCTNLNFGAEWPGNNCEGNQDYVESIESHSRSNFPSVFLERLWVNDSFVYGMKLGIDINSGQSLSSHKVLSTTWGDTLDYKIKLKDAMHLNAILGQQVDDWLPYLGAGIVFQRINIFMRQDQTGYNLPALQDKSKWITGTELIVGVKRQFSEDWVASAEYSLLKLNALNEFTTASLKSGGLRYPNTQISANADTKLIRISLSRRF